MLITTTPPQFAAPLITRAVPYINSSSDLTRVNHLFSIFQRRYTNAVHSPSSANLGLNTYRSSGAFPSMVELVPYDFAIVDSEPAGVLASAIAVAPR
jgi:hypothetical protein